MDFPSHVYISPTVLFTGSGDKRDFFSYLIYFSLSQYPFNVKKKNGISSEISKFADDSKIGRIIKSKSDVKELHGDLDWLNEWVVKWQMDFNIDKCKVINIGKENPQNRYNINRLMLNRS